MYEFCYYLLITYVSDNIDNIVYMKKGLTFGSRELNKLLDDTLMLRENFASETLMEIAGLSVAQFAHIVLQRQTLRNVLVLVGPGNNGGDGLVAARHLKMMDYDVYVAFFKDLEGKNGNYLKLCQLNDIKTQNVAQSFGKPGTYESQTQFSYFLKKFGLIVDAVFGFPFTGNLRSPYDSFLPLLKHFENNILSVDIPSGWDANTGNINNLFTPKYLISLGIPKKCSETFQGEHYLGGRFIPPKIAEYLDIVLPKYYGANLICKL